MALIVLELLLADLCSDPFDMPKLLAGPTQGVGGTTAAGPWSARPEGDEADCTRGRLEDGSGAIEPGPWPAWLGHGCRL